MKIRTYVSKTKWFEKQLERMPDYIKEKIRTWILLVEFMGLSEVMKTPGYHDEPLKGKRFGQRSIRLNRSYRLIYRVIEDHVHIELLEAHKHDY